MFLFLSWLTTGLPPSYIYRRHLGQTNLRDLGKDSALREAILAGSDVTISIFNRSTHPTDYIGVTGSGQVVAFAVTGFGMTTSGNHGSAGSSLFQTFHSFQCDGVVQEARWAYGSHISLGLVQRMVPMEWTLRNTWKLV